MTLEFGLKNNHTIAIVNKQKDKNIKSQGNYKKTKVKIP